MNVIYHYILFFFLACLLSCAQFGTPQGGPKDQDPPYIIKELSEANMQTNFNKRKFQIHFNEWIKLSNPSKEVVISPPTDYPLKITVRGKALNVEFSEEEKLKEDATYQINFGDAVRDFTESNIYKNMIFVFSTGDIIDSLSISGSIFNATDGKPRANVLVCLYDDLSDSCIVKQKPFYFTKTDKSGRYKLNNIRNDTFQIFALKDENVNYYFDLSSEEVGFKDQALFLNDSNLINIDLEIFDEKDFARLIDYRQDYKGLIKAKISAKVKDLEVQSLSKDSIFIYHEYQNDSLYIWHNDLASDSSQFVIKYENKTDSLLNKKTKNSVLSIPLSLGKSNNNSISFHKSDTLDIAFNKPLSRINGFKVFLKDSNIVYSIDYQKVSNKLLRLKISGLENAGVYTLQILPDSLEDIYGIKNLDTIQLELNVFDPKQFGNINLNVINTLDTSYIIQFMDGNKSLGEYLIDSSQTLTFDKLAKGSYLVKIIEDLNGDNEWTSGLVVKKRMPEKIKEISLEELKPGWDLDLDIKIKEIFYGTPIE